MIPPWLSLALDLAMPELTAGQRDRAAAAMIDALPGRSVASSISESTGVVLHQRGILDHDGSLAREIGNNSAQSVLFTLSEAE